MVEIGLIEISAPPNWNFLGAGGQNVSVRTKGFQSICQKFLVLLEPFWDSVGMSELRPAAHRTTRIKFLPMILKDRGMC